MFRYVLPFLSIAVLLTACSGDDDPSGPTRPEPVAMLEFRAAPDLLTVGERVRLVAVPRGASGEVLEGRTITWTSSAQEVAPITAAGDLTAASEGETVVSAVSEGKAARHTVRVTFAVRPVARVTIIDGDQTLAVGESLTPSVVAHDQDGRVIGGKTPTWSSTNRDVALVSDAGLITAAQPGTARVYAIIDGVADSIDIEVRSTVARVAILPAEALLIVGDVVQAEALAYGEGNTILNVPITWASDDATTVSVDRTGRLTAHRAGLVRITASAQGVVGEAVVSVVGATDFDATLVNGAALPATMFSREDANGTTRYDAHAGTFRLIANGRYEQVFQFWVHAAGAPGQPGSFTSSGDVSRDHQTGEFVFTPDAPGAPAFRGVKVDAATLQVTQRYYANATEATVRYTVR